MSNILNDDTVSLNNSVELFFDILFVDGDTESDTESPLFCVKILYFAPRLAAFRRARFGCKVLPGMALRKWRRAGSNRQPPACKAGVKRLKSLGIVE